MSPNSAAGTWSFFECRILQTGDEAKRLDEFNISWAERSLFSTTSALEQINTTREKCTGYSYCSTIWWSVGHRYSGLLYSFDNCLQAPVRVVTTSQYSQCEQAVTNTTTGWS